MLFHFTTISELDIQNSRGGNDMIDAINYDGDRDLLITGRPGSGKTTVTIMRALRLHELKIRPLFLTKHTLLAYSLRNAYPQLRVVIQQIDSWFFDATNEWLSEQTDGINMREKLSRSVNRYAEVLIDEGQDLRRHVYTAITVVGQRFTVGADTAQKIHALGADAAVIEEEFELQQRAVRPVVLEFNYRNFVETYDFARQFVPNYPLANLELILHNTTRGPGGSERVPRVIQVRNKFDQLLTLLEENSASNIAIGLFTQADVEMYWRELQHRGVECSRYHNTMDRSAKRALELNMHSVLVTTLASMKGLEFQVVVLPGMEQALLPGSMQTPTHYYVGCTRATERLYLLYESATFPSCLSGFRADSYRLITPSSITHPNPSGPVTTTVTEDLPF